VVAATRSPGALPLQEAESPSGRSLDDGLWCNTPKGRAVQQLAAEGGPFSGSGTGQGASVAA
jgi:hypothetical protein